jgi:IclR family transcriptional regulator, pca regulon regulatory protein
VVSTEGERADDPAFVQSLARGLAVIRAFDAEHPRMSLSDIARATDLTRATARRFLLTLEHLGYVRSVDREFSLTPHVLELGFSYLSALSLPEAAQPHLEALSREVGESASASVLDGADIVYVARVPMRRIMSVSITIGTRFPASATSMGRVLLAALATAELDAYLAGFQGAAFTSRTVTDESTLRRELGRVAEQGYSVVDQELEDGLWAVAAPVRRGTSVVAAINIATTAGGAPLDRLLAPLLDTARALSAELEHLPG